MSKICSALAVDGYSRKSKQTHTWVCRGVILKEAKEAAIAHVVYCFSDTGSELLMSEA